MTTLKKKKKKDLCNPLTQFYEEFIHRDVSFFCGSQQTGEINFPGFLDSVVLPCIKFH